MTCVAVTPWWRSRRRRLEDEIGGGVNATAILDWRADRVRLLVGELDAGLPVEARLLQAHALIAQQVRPVYALDELQSASRTLDRGYGSCSQRLAVLEAVARSQGVATRSRALVIDGRFWYPRFPHLRFMVPRSVVLAWPEFLVDGAWTSAPELLVGRTESQPQELTFTNAGEETLFDAVARTRISWDVVPEPAAATVCDLSGVVVGDLGHYSSRDEVFAVHGHTLCRPAQAIVQPVLSHWSAGA